MAVQRTAAAPGIAWAAVLATKADQLMTEAYPALGWKASAKIVFNARGLRAAA